MKIRTNPNKIRNLIPQTLYIHVGIRILAKLSQCPFELGKLLSSYLNLSSYFTIGLPELRYLTQGKLTKFLFPFLCCFFFDRSSCFLILLVFGFPSQRIISHHQGGLAQYSSLVLLFRHLNHLRLRYWRWRQCLTASFDSPEKHTENPPCKETDLTEGPPKHFEETGNAHEHKGKNYLCDI